MSQQAAAVVQLRPRPRVANLTANEECPICLDDGVCVVATERRKAANTSAPDFDVDLVGPCPRCERGFRAEFPTSGKPGPWGPSGYWQGREIPAELLG